MNTLPKCKEHDLTSLSEKGQVVIPAAIRTKLNLKPKTKLLVYSCEDAVILKKMEIPDFTEEIEAMYKRVQEKTSKYGGLTQEEVEEEIQEYRKEKAKKS